MDGCNDKTFVHRFCVLHGSEKHCYRKKAASVGQNDRHSASSQCKLTPN